MERTTRLACAEQAAEQAMDAGKVIELGRCSTRGCKLLISETTGCAMIRGDCLRKSQGTRPETLGNWLAVIHSGFEPEPQSF